MLDVSRPRCEATVSPELIRLLRLSATPGPARARPVPAEKAADVEQATAIVAPLPEPAVQAAESGGGGWPSVVLRVDGQWPKRFRGLLLCESTSRIPLQDQDGDTDVVRVLRLYLTEDLQVVAHGICGLEGVRTARPIHRISPIEMPDDLRQLVRAIGSPGCHAMMPDTCVDHPHPPTYRTLPSMGLVHG
jgi:hypothetical protein